MDSRALKEIFRDESEPSERKVEHRGTDEKDKIKGKLEELKGKGRI